MPIARSRLRLTAEELDELLTSERTVHAATVSADGLPHVVPLWYVWHAGAVWLNNLRRSRRSRDLAAGSPVSLCVDTGYHYPELRGAVIYGRPEEVAADDRELPAVRQAFGDRYFAGMALPDVRSHVWLKVVPEDIVTWDFRKMPAWAPGAGGAD